MVDSLSHDELPGGQITANLQRGEHGLRGVGGPLADRDVGPGAGDHRRGGQREDRHQPVADPARLARVGHQLQLFKQVTAASLDRLGRRVRLVWVSRAHGLGRGHAGRGRLRAQRSSRNSADLGRSPVLAELRCILTGDAPSRDQLVIKSSSLQSATARLCRGPASGGAAPKRTPCAPSASGCHRRGARSPVATGEAPPPEPDPSADIPPF